MMDYLRQRLLQTGLDEGPAELAAVGTGLLGIALLAVAVHFVARRILLRIIRRVAERTKTAWDDALIERKVFNRLAHVAPALVIWNLAPAVLGAETGLGQLVRRGAEVYMLVMAILVVAALLRAVEDIYKLYPVARKVPIRGYLQVVQLLVILAGGIYTVALLLGRSPWALFTGLGAMTAVLLLVFRDTILGFVAGIMLNANDMVRPGDWIEMPKYGADGTVTEVALTTVKVRNWDKTISTVPTYALIADSFRNWRGMEESGGRRIKRSIMLDVGSIRFCDDAMIDRFSKIELIGDYVREKLAEVDDDNRQRGIDSTVAVNGRRMTNIGTFRAYLVAYLRSHPLIHDDMTFLVRQLQPNERGLPIEVYVFSRDQEWANYEAIQADIFDHVYAALDFFDLRPFQSPTGHDIRAAMSGRLPA